MRLAVIPARGGSKRIPRKNIKPFCGKPMIAWSIEAALQSGCFDAVIVSTDDAEIAEVARHYGADVPFMRPPELSDDFTGTNAVIVHAIDFFESKGIKVNTVACIYATAPFLQPVKIREGMNLLREDQSLDYAVTVTKYPFPIQRSLKMLDDGRLGLREPVYATSRSQDLEEFYHDAGQLYCGRSSSFRNSPTVFMSAISPILLHPKNVQDIDTPDDWERAELLFKIINKRVDE